VSDLADGPGPLNEAAVLIALCEAADGAAQKAAEEAMTPLAEKYIKEAKAAGEDGPKVTFAIAKSAGSISGQLRKLMSLPSMPPQKHEHKLEEFDNNGGRWGCDGCSSSGTADGKRFRCTEGCDFDYCESCNSKAGTGPAMPPKLMLINIPEGGAFFDGPEGDVTADSVKDFVAAFESGSLVRKQLER